MQKNVFKKNKKFKKKKQKTEHRSGGAANKGCPYLCLGLGFCQFVYFFCACIFFLPLPRVFFVFQMFNMFNLIMLVGLFISNLFFVNSLPIAENLRYVV